MKSGSYVKSSDASGGSKTSEAVQDSVLGRVRSLVGSGFVDSLPRSRSLRPKLLHAGLHLLQNSEQSRYHLAPERTLDRCSAALISC